MTAANPSPSSAPEAPPKAPPKAPLRIAIFRAGTHTSAEGKRLTFTEADLRATAAAYDPAAFKAPLVIGHPAHDAPAYGWVSGLAVEGGTLLASFDEVSDAARELVGAGHYRHVSAQFYPPGSPASPAPGGYSLRHVGLLGAQPPAVKGLPQVSFGDAGADLVTFSEPREAWWAVARLGRAIAGLMRRNRDSLIDASGIETADQQLPDWEISSLDEAARIISDHAAEMREPAVVGFNEPEDQDVDPAELARLRAEIDALKAERDRLAAEQASFAEAEAIRAAEARRTQTRAELDRLAVDGKVAPAMVGPLATFLEAIDSKDPAAPVSFAEGEAAVAPRDWLLAQIARSPALISFGEVSAPKPADDAGAPPKTADQYAARIHKLMAEEAISFAEAAARVTADASA